MMLKILSESHSSECHKLHSLCFDTAWSQETFTNYLCNPSVLILGYYDHDQLIGFIVISIIVDDAEVYTLCVDPNHRQKGIASQLLETTFIELQNRLIIRVFLEVAITNHAAYACYTRKGFSEIGIRKNYYTINNIPTDAKILEKLVF